MLAACSSTSTGSDALMTSATGTEGAPAKKAAQLPRCEQPLGTVAMVEKDIPALEGTGLSSPSAVLRLMIAESNCFQVVDRGETLERIKEERQVSKKGKRAQIAKADYFLTPDVISKNENAGGIDGGFGRLLPGYAGTVASSVSVKVQEAQVAIYLTNGKTGVQVAAATGKASTADAGFDVSRASWGGAGGGGAYANTDIGKTIGAAFADAYANLVRQAQAQAQQVARAPTPAPKTTKR
jgi:curli biogenesis system outer membrane secretion channel CsgG